MPQPLLRRAYVLPVSLCLVAALPLHAAEQDCGPIYVQGQFGPWDYTDPANRAYNLRIVEEYHFAPRTEQLVEATSVAGPAGIAADLDYVLRTIPNHHRALYSMMRFQLENARPRTATYRSTACYFDRAIRFKNDDPVVYMLQGIYFQRTGDNKAALESYRKSLELRPNLTEAHYNIGLLYADTGDYDRALEHARRAYELGYPMQGLRNKLVRAGRWPSDRTADEASPN